MLPFPALQQKLAFEIHSRFTKKVFEAQNADELCQPAKELILTIAELILPEKKIVFEEKQEMPQEVPEE